MTQNSSNSVVNDLSTQVKEITRKTEDTGKIFERAICLTYDIPYDGKYKYGLENANELKPRLNALKELFPMCKHTAKRGARYDFTTVENPEQHLSAKTTKKGVGKVAPQVIGQSQPKKFCELLNIPFTTISALKEYIQTHITNLLPHFVSFTFDCPTVYYNERDNTIRYITLNREIEWNTFEYSWTCHWSEWNNSVSLKIKTNDKEINLLEIQFHTKSRTNMAIRWYYEHFLMMFKDHLQIINL
jgi:hypothetical protein